MAMSDYELLKTYGHSPVKAAEIVLDAKRGDPHAVSWLRVARGVANDEPRPVFYPGDAPIID
jgi:hypothetical protein